MKLSLYQRLSFALLSAFVTITVVFILWWLHVEKETRAEAEQRLNLSLAANLVRDNPLLQQGNYDYDALKNLFHTSMILGPAFEFYLLDEKGRILTHSIPLSSVKRKTIDLTPIHELNKNIVSLPIYGDDPKDLNRKKIFSTAPIFNGSDLQGYLYVIVAGEQYENAFNSLQKNNRIKASLLLIIAGLTLLFVLMLWLFHAFTKPIRRLTKQMAQFQSSGFNLQSLQEGAVLTDTQLKEYPILAVNHALSTEQTLNKLGRSENDEIAKLTHVFNIMAQQINGQLTELNNVDTKRRELLTEISHDLRTPLASFKGYVETLAIKGEELSPEIRKQYVNTALKGASQLNDLIDQIFELAHLESGQTSISLESFNLTELMYDVVDKYQIKATKAEVALSLQLAENHFFVLSDIGKLERILSNLIDNAIRHTHAGGAVILAVDDFSDNEISLKVIDNGTGIKDEEIAYIFEARYRASNATTGQHSGLGLAISKKLSELLSCDLKVKSQLGQGTTFSLLMEKPVCLLKE